MQLLKRLSLYIFVGLLAYMPLHIFLSTWIGTSFGILDFAKIAKDILLVLGFVLVLVSSIGQPWFRQLLKDKLVWLIGAYAIWTVLLAALKPTDADAEILGVVYNLRFLMFFLYGVLLTKLFDAQLLKAIAIKTVLAVSVIVLFFGVVQYTVLPNDALTHAGYSRTNGVLPAFFIDNKPDLERVMSTVRDPNSFGSYVIIIGMLVLALVLGKRLPKQTAFGLLALSGLCLLFTFSRSAWLGFVIGAMTLVALHFRGRLLQGRQLKRAVAGIAALLVLGLLALYPLRNTYLVQNVIFHADKSTVLEDPNELRTRFLRESVGEIADEPLGHGPGTAGLVSVRNEKQGTLLNENYYLQIGHEVGVIGLLLFIAILAMIGLRLLVATKLDPLSLGLLAAFMGLAFTNLLVHIWSNETVAYTWWGLAGLVIAPHAIARKAS